MPKRFRTYSLVGLTLALASYAQHQGKGKIVILDSTGRNVAEPVQDPIMANYCTAQRLVNFRDALLQARSEKIETGTQWTAVELARKFQFVAGTALETKLRTATLILGAVDLNFDIRNEDGRRFLLNFKDAQSGTVEEVVMQNGREVRKILCTIGLPVASKGAPESWVKVGARDTARDLKKLAGALVIETEADRKAKAKKEKENGQ